MSIHDYDDADTYRPGERLDAPDAPPSVPEPDFDCERCGDTGVIERSDGGDHEWEEACPRGCDAASRIAEDAVEAKRDGWDDRPWWYGEGTAKSHLD